MAAMVRLHGGRSCHLSCPRLPSRQQVGNTLFERPRTAVSASKGSSKGGSKGNGEAQRERQDASGRQVPRQHNRKRVPPSPAQTSNSAFPTPQQGSDNAATSDPWRQPPASSAAQPDKPATGPKQQQGQQQSQHQPDDPSVAQSQQADTDLINDPWRTPAAATGPGSTPIEPATGPPQQQRQDQLEPRQEQQQQQGGRARLSWRSRSGPAAAAASTGQQQQGAQGAAPRLSWRSSSSSSQPTDTTASTTSHVSPDPEDNQSAQAAAFAADTADDDSPATLYAAANPAPEFFRDQVHIASDDEIDIFMVQGMNTRYATPEPRERIGEDSDDLTSAYTASITEAKHQLPQENQQALSRIAAAAAAAFAAARLRPGGLSPDDLNVAETAADVAALTQSTFTAKIALEVVQDIAEGRQPDPQSIELVMDPSTISLEALGAHGPTFDEAILRTAEGLPPFDDPWSMSGEVALQYLEQCRSWESAARVYMAARHTPAMSTPQLLCLFEVLPELVNPQELGFRAQLRWRTLVQDIMNDLIMRPESSSQLTPTNIHTIIVSLGRMHLPSGPLQLPQSNDDKSTEALLGLVTNHLRGFSVRQLGDVLWGLGKAEVTVAPQWVETVWKDFAGRAQDTPLDTLSLSKALYGCALLHHKPQRPTLKAFFNSSKQHMDEFTPVQIINMLWAVATLDLQPPPSWLMTVLGELTNGQTWSTDGQTICHGMDHGVEVFDRQELAAAASDLAAGAAAAAAAGDQGSFMLLPAAAAVPASIAAAAARADPYIYQPVKEGPLPFARHSTEYYWTHLLDGSDCGSSSSSSSVGLVSADLPRVLPVAPPTLLTLDSKQLLQLVESLSDLQLCSEDERVADLLDQIWAAAVHSSSSSSSRGDGGFGGDQDPADAASGKIPVSQLGARQQGGFSSQQQQQQQQRTAGFGGPKQSRKGKAKKQQQQQQQQSARASSSSSSWVDSQLVAHFDEASGGLWTAAMQGNWSLRQLAAAAAMLSSSSSSSDDTTGVGSSSVSDPSTPTDQSHDHNQDQEPDQDLDTLETLDLEDLDLGDLDLADLAAAAAAANSSAPAAATLKDASAAVFIFMNAWYAASNALLPHTEPAAAVAMLRAVAVCTSARQSPFAPGALPQHWQQQQQQQKLGMPPPSRADVTSNPLNSEQQQQQQQQVPPLPPTEWIAAVVRRLVIARSALSEVALLHALEALDKILQDHPQRKQLLLPPQQQQQQQQRLWWWQQLQQAWLEHKAAPAAASAGGSSAVEAGSSDNVNHVPSAAAAAAAAATPTTVYDSSWMFAQSLTSVTNTINSNSSSSSSQPISSSSSSLLTGLQKLVKCSQQHLGSLLNMEGLVQLLAHTVRLSPQLVDKSWLQHHERTILQLLQQEGWAPSGSSSRSALQSSCLSAVEAGLTPEMCGVLLICYDECSYDMQHHELREVCEVLAGLDDT